LGSAPAPWAGGAFGYGRRAAGAGRAGRGAPDHPSLHRGRAAVSCPAGHGDRRPGRCHRRVPGPGGPPARRTGPRICCFPCLTGRPMPRGGSSAQIPGSAEPAGTPSSTRPGGGPPTCGARAPHGTPPCPVTRVFPSRDVRDLSGARGSPNAAATASTTDLQHDLAAGVPVRDPRERLAHLLQTAPPPRPGGAARPHRPGGAAPPAAAVPASSLNAPSLAGRGGTFD
jgi:hypothetical protein